ncbi:MAG: LysM peptidoglycan-binding domain-containing protein [Calditrichaceae bacterium]
MIKKTFPILAILIALFIGSCQTTKLQRPVATDHNYLSSFPDNIWVSEEVNSRLDSLFFYFNQAQRKLSDHDTMGAELYFDYTFELQSKFTDQDRSTLTNWAVYDSMMHLINDAYERLYTQKEIDMAAEEIREDITDFEESFYADSVLFGDGTVIDSSGLMPITLNNKVRLAIKYFQTKGRPVFTRWLERSGRYEPMVREILREKNLPEDLVYLAMIESGFNPHAYSYARAAGMWQFISATGRYYGLRHDWWFDERRDYFKATIAAAEHLDDLYERFDDWYLALAGYNCNPKKVEKNMRRYDTRDFWQLRSLPRQTRNYVPTFLAATIIAKDPEKFGFYVDKSDPIEIDMVEISESIDLNVVAKAVDTTYSYIKEINPAVLRWVTPPGVKNFNLYLPKGKAQQFKEKYASLPDNEKRSWVRHKIQSGQTLSTIAQKYHTSIAVIKETNRLSGNMIRAGHYLLIPVPQNSTHFKYSSVSYSQSSKPKRQSRPKAVITNVPGHKKIIYEVKSGNTLGEIAEIFKTRASEIRSWNGLRYGSYIYPKQKLVIWVPEDMDEIRQNIKKEIVTVSSRETGNFYTVRSGDTLWDIAKKYGISIKELKKINNLNNTMIKPGDRLKVSTN